MLVLVEEEKRKRPTPTPSPPPHFLNSSPPPTPPREGRGGRAVYILIILHTTDSAPHAESTTLSREFWGEGGGNRKKCTII